jgi:hypothetical protein
MRPPVIYIQERKKSEPVWLKAVAPDDLANANSFLRLAFPDPVVNAILKAFKTASVAQMSAKDILRASGSPFLDEKVPGVARQLDLIDAGEPLSPILFVRGSAQAMLDGVLADGLHRTLAVYALDPEAKLPVKLASVDWAALQNAVE